MASELRERIEKLERDQKTVKGRLYREETLADRYFWPYASGFGLLGLGAGIINLFEVGFSEVDFVTIILITVGGLLTYRWHEQDKARKLDRETLDDIKEELRAAKNELR